MTVVIDGGLATELEAQGHDLTDRLWSARLLLRDPSAIEGAHLAYFRAGARVATTASYQATVPGFAAAGLDAATAIGAIRASVTIAGRARDRYADDTGASRDGLLVAGSVGPYGAMLADGSEYRGDYDPGPAALRDLHAPRMEALLEAGADLLAMETIPTVREAEVLVGLLDELDATGWLSYQCRDGATTAAGEPIASAFGVAAGVAGVLAVGVNCTAPRLIPSLLARAEDVVPDLPRIAYPNGGDAWDAVARRWVTDDRDVDRGLDPAAMAAWPGAASMWLGGCCGTTPATIGALAAAVAG